jgi:ABC-type Fe3+/spermidine/putrescine transport system ATPase subunit
VGALVLQNIHKTFNGTIACTDINLTIAEGEFFTLLGPSGCGKTTILRLIAGFIKSKKGSIHLGDRNITHLDAEKRPVGMVFQNFALFPFMSVKENIEYGLRVQKAPRSIIQHKVNHYLQLVGLSGFENRSISDLSGGEQQRVALARSLVIEPKVLLLDEPLSNLDARLRDKMRLEIKALQRKLGITTIFVTHDQTEALTMSDRIAVFDRGRSVQVGTPEEIYANPNSAFVARFIGDTNLFEVAIKDGKAHIADELTIDLPGTIRQGQYISIRPQDILLTTTDPGWQNTFKGRLQDTQLNGVWIEHFIAVNGIDFRVIVLNTNDHIPKMKPGQAVFISLKENGIKVLST